MTDIHVIGLGIAKSVFQLHGRDEAGAVVLRKRLTERGWRSSRSYRPA